MSQKESDIEKLENRAIWTTADVCRYYRIGRETLLTWVARGLPRYKIDSRYMFERNQVKAFVRKHRD